MFYLFGMMHTMSYTTSLLLGFTLDMERGVYGLLLLLLYYKYLDRRTIYLNIAVLYISIFTSIYTFDIKAHVQECIGFVLYYNVALIFWKVLGSRQLTPTERLKHFYSFLSIPLLVYISPILLTPNNINLDFYSDPNLEKIGLKSRTVGWASACSIPMVLQWTSKDGPRKFIIYLALAILIVLTIGSGSRSAIIGASLFVLALIYSFNIKQRISYAILLIFFTAFILQNIDQLSLSRRAELHKMGVSDDTFRQNLVLAFSEHLVEDFPSSLKPEGLGEPNIQHGLNKFFDTKGFGTHNSYISIILGLGFFSIIFLYRMFRGLKKLARLNYLKYFLPFLTISITEDCFGPGQLLYFFLIGSMVVLTE